MKFLKAFFTTIIIAACVLFGCTDENSKGTTGSLSIKMTDAPFPYELVDEANITVYKIEARNTDQDAESPYHILSEEEKTLQLLQLTNGVTETLVDIEVPAGSYDLIRLYIKSATVKLTDGRLFDLKVPSGQQTGLKIFIKPAIVVEGGLSSDLLLDFDVSKSFIPKGNIHTPAGIHGFNFKPVIKAANLSTTGTLLGYVSDSLSNPLEGVQLSIYTADTLNTTTFTDSLGNYTVLGLSEGSYKAEAALEGYITEAALFEIVAANHTTQNFVLRAQE